MSRQQKFEEAYAEAHGLPIETFEQYRMGDTYRLPGIAKCWRFWNMALDSVVVELPPEWAPVSERDDGANEMREHCVSAIEAAGLKVKS